MGRESALQYFIGRQQLSHCVPHSTGAGGQFAALRSYKLRCGGVVAGIYKAVRLEITRPNQSVVRFSRLLSA
jgi:hypothetical protein